MPTQTLQLVGKFEHDAGRQYARLYFDHGDGFTPSVLVGHSSGVRTYRYVYTAPDRTGDSRFMVTDAEDSVSKTWSDYLEDFHGRRMVDGAAFNVTDQKTGSTVLVTFAGENAQALTFRAIGKKVYACELLLRQYRAAA